ncbi:MAG TPA: aminotransferase class IV [Flavitalea sp.]|nr:aminotransferase class IV [Flavitalea sp.]
MKEIAGRYISVDGKLYSAAAPVIGVEHRIFRYGEGLFETMRCRDGGIPLFDMHMDRLLSGIALLELKLPENIDRDFLLHAINTLLKENECSKSSKVRIQVSAGLLNDPQNISQIVIQTSQIESGWQFNDIGLTADVFTSAQKSCDSFSNMKSCNYMIYSMAARYAANNHTDECFVLNVKGRICDASISNVFWISKGKIFTPPLTEGGIAGVMRRYLLSQLSLSGLEVEEKQLELKLLYDANEIFVTNAVKGIRWIGSFHGKTYTNTLSKTIFNHCVNIL